MLRWRGSTLSSLQSKGLARLGSPGQHICWFCKLLLREGLAQSLHSAVKACLYFRRRDKYGDRHMNWVRLQATLLLPFLGAVV